MTRTIAVGLDGSAESLAAAEWAAREARMRGLRLTLVHVDEPPRALLSQAPLLGPETQQDWSERMPRETAERLTVDHPGLDIAVQRREGRAAEVLTEAGKEAEMLALGSRGLGGVRGFVSGSVALAVVGHSERPVVLVRAAEVEEDEHLVAGAGATVAGTEGAVAGTGGAAAKAGGAVAGPPYKPVVLGVDPYGLDQGVADFAFEAAAVRGTALHAVYSWSVPPYYERAVTLDHHALAEISREEARALTALLAPWRERFPQVEVVGRSQHGKAAVHLVEAARDASLVVVGRRLRHRPLGARVGPVTHAVLHHAAVPVAVVAHG